MGIIFSAISAALCCCNTATCLSGCCATSDDQKSVHRSIVARIRYMFLFLLFSIIAFVFKDYGSVIFGGIPAVYNQCTSLLKECQGNVVVYRVTFALATFYGLMALLTIGPRPSQKDIRTSIQNGLWLVKLIVFILFLVGTFFIPNEVFLWYARVSMFGGALFVLIQLIILVDYAFWLNDYLVDRANKSPETEKKMVRIGTFSSCCTLYCKCYYCNCLLCIFCMP